MAWKPFQELDFNNTDFQWYNIDTRDFHGVEVLDSPKFKYQMPVNLDKNQDKWFFTPDEVKTLLERYFTESGGPGSWRMFQLSDAGKQVSAGWNMKYIIILRHKRGLLICSRVFNDKIFPIKKAILNSPVDKREEYLNHIKDEL